MATFYKDPDAVLDYEYNWAAWLPAGDTITSYTVTIEDGLTKDSDTGTSTAVTFWVSGGTIGETYECTVHIVTAEGREDDRTRTIKVIER